jgi:hypothetical protein
MKALCPIAALFDYLQIKETIACDYLLYNLYDICSFRGFMQTCFMFEYSGVWKSADRQNYWEWS